MSTVFQTPTVERLPRVVPLHKATLPETEFVDKDGDVWVPSGYNGRGELELICPNPQDPREDGEGEPRRWSLHGVQSAFGPLIARSAVSS